MTKLEHCQRCPRLTAFRREQKAKYPDYYCRPVAAFGDDDASLLIVGLAPGLHGANASGRPFTGDTAGRVLFQTLHKFGFASRPLSMSNGDGLRLIDCRITNAVKCLPPNNRPSTEESKRCNPYLRAEISMLKRNAVILALGGIAHQSILRAQEIPLSRIDFQHLAERTLGNGLRLIDSYHCSRYNMNTGRLTTAMFEQVFAHIRRVIG